MSINLLLLRFTKGSSRKYFLSSCLSCFLPTEFKLLNLGLGQISYSYSVLQSSRISVLSKRLSSGTEACIEGLTRPGLRSMSSKNMSTSNNVSLNEEVVETGIDVEDVPKEDKQRRSKRKRKQSDTNICGVCNEVCEGRSVYCGSCNVWYHYKCESITRSPRSLVQVNSLLREYICTTCCQNHNGLYNFDSAISRLTESAAIGQLEQGVRMEQILLRNESEFNLQQVSKKTKYQIDRTADQILKKYVPHVTSIPTIIHGDGNCLFSALSVAVFGDSTKAAELRVRTTIEMVSNRDFYKKVHVRSGLLLVSPDLDEACVECAQNGCFSSAWTIHAASSVLGRPIRSVYPPVNGLRDRCYKILDRTFAPRNLTDSKDVMIMWSGNIVGNEELWIPNHFVPLVCTVEPVVINSTIDESEPSNDAPNILTQPVEVLSESDDSTAMVVEASPPDKSTALHLALTNSSQKVCDVVMRELDRFLTPSDVLKVMITYKPTVRSIPKGVKQNIYFVIDNINQYSDCKKTLYTDDCGLWSNKPSCKRHHYMLDGQRLSYVDFKNGKYCKDVKGKRLPMKTQPDKNKIIVFKRYYGTLKRDTGYRKRISTVIECPKEMTYLQNLALVEYLGLYPQDAKINGENQLRLSSESVVEQFDEDAKFWFHT